MIIRLRQGKGRKGVTLVEMIVAIAIVAILATVLSLMMVPVTSMYKSNQDTIDLIEATSYILEDIAAQMRSATGVYVSSTAKSFPDIANPTKTNTQYYLGVRPDESNVYHAVYGIALCAYSAQDEKDITGYLYPHVKVVDASNITKPKLVTLETFLNDKQALPSNIYQTSEIGCKSTEDFYFYVRENPDSLDGSGNKLVNVMEFHLKVWKENRSYEVTKTVVCDNLVVYGSEGYGKNICTANFFNKPLAKATVGTKYYSVWYSKR